MTEPTALPPLDDDRVSALEARVFRSIGAERALRGARRRRFASIGGVAAGLLVVAVVVGPLVGGGPRSGSASSAAGSSALEQAPGFASGQEALPSDVDGQTGAAESADAADDPVGREVVTTATATVSVASVPAAITALSETAGDLGGYVESSTTSETASTSEGASSGTAIDPYYPAPIPDGGGVISIRVPAHRLTEASDSLSGLGTVTASSVDRRDVTTQAVDLRARVDAAQASVDRLTELVAQAGSLADLLAAESALADRQATLESYQQQLTVLESQVSLATLTVTVLPESSPVTAEPTGFLDGLLAGWNGLVAAANGALVGIGFLLPWLAVAGVVALLVVVVRRRRGPPAGRRPVGGDSAEE